MTPLTVGCNLYGILMFYLYTQCNCTTKTLQFYFNTNALLFYSYTLCNCTTKTLQFYFPITTLLFYLYSQCDSTAQPLQFYLAIKTLLFYYYSPVLVHGVIQHQWLQIFQLLQRNVIPAEVQLMMHDFVVYNMRQCNNWGFHGIPGMMRMWSNVRARHVDISYNERKYTYITLLFITWSSTGNNQACGYGWTSMQLMLRPICSSCVHLFQGSTDKLTLSFITWGSAGKIKLADRILRQRKYI